MCFHLHPQSGGDALRVTDEQKRANVLLRQPDLADSAGSANQMQEMKTDCSTRMNSVTAIFLKVLVGEEHSATTSAGLPHKILGRVGRASRNLQFGLGSPV